MAITLFLLEDHELIRGGVRSLLGGDHYEIIAEYARPSLMLKDLEAGLTPDIIIMDISLPEMNGLEVSAFIRENYPNIKIIILSMHKDEEYVLEAMTLDVMGYVVKDSVADQIKEAIDKVHEGGKYFSKEVVNMALSTHKRMKAHKKQQKEIRLTKREKEVLNLIAQGQINQEVAETLFISERTVEAHRANIMKKIGARNTAELIRKAMKYQMIE